MSFKLRTLAGLGILAVLHGVAFAQPVDLDAAPNEVPTHLVKVLRTSNKAQTNRYVPKVYDFQHVNPYAVIRFVRRAMEIEESAWFAFANEGHTGGKILVVVPEYQVASLDQLMALIDRQGLTSSSGTKRLFYQHRYRDAFDPGLIAATANEGTPTAVLIPDNQTNGWLVEDSPSGLARIADSLINHYDKPVPQCEAVITAYEVDVTDDGQLGLDYVSWKNGPGRNLFSLGAFAQKEKITTLDSPAALLYNSGKGTHNLSSNQWEATGRNGALFYDLPSAFFDFLVVKGRARVLTKSKLSVLDRSTALLEVGEDILYYHEQHNPDLRAGSRLQPLDPYGDLEAVVDTNTGGQVTDDYGVIIADHPDNRTVVPKLAQRVLGEASTGLFVQFTPTINSIGCAIAFDLSLVNLIGWADDGSPQLASRSMSQVFKIPHDGREITLGGLVRQNRVDSTNGMPWLSDIPGLGYLFGGESRLDKKTMVLVTFRIRVVPEEGTFGEGDAALMETVDGVRELTVPDNDPGFLQK